MYPVLCTNTHRDVMRWLKIQKPEYLENGTSLFHKIKKFLTCAPDDTF